MSRAGCLPWVMLLLLVGPEIDERALLPLGPEIEERVLPPLRPEFEERMLLLGREKAVRILLPFGPATGECILLAIVPETCDRMLTPPSFRAANLLPKVLGGDLTIFENSSLGACETMLGVVGAELLFECMFVGAGRAKGFGVIARRFPCCLLFVAAWRRCSGVAKMGPMDSSHHLGKERLPMIIPRVSKSGISCLNLHPCCEK